MVCENGVKELSKILSNRFPGETFTSNKKGHFVSARGLSLGVVGYIADNDTVEARFDAHLAEQIGVDTVEVKRLLERAMAERKARTAAWRAGRAERG